MTLPARFLFLFIFAVGVSFLITSNTLAGMPFTTRHPDTLTTSIEDHDLTVIATWENAQAPDPQHKNSGSTTFKITKILHSKVQHNFQVSNEIIYPIHLTQADHQQVILFGELNSSWEWFGLTSISASGITYISKLPENKLPQEERLKFFLNYLNDSDELISYDVYNELQQANIKSFIKISNQLPAAEIRKHVFKNPHLSGSRNEIYGILLGLCGNEQDKKDLEQYCTLDTTDYRLGIDGCMAGYLYLSGEEGLKKLEATKLTAKTASGNPIQLNEVYATLSAIRFMHDYGGDKIPKSRIAQSIRLLLPYEIFADLAVAELARLKDWDTSDQLIKLYAQTPDTDRRLKRSIAGFFVVCEADKPQDATTDPPHVTKAKNFLAQIEKTEPKIVEYARKVYEVSLPADHLE